MEVNVCTVEAIIIIILQYTNIRSSKKTQGYYIATTSHKIRFEQSVQYHNQSQQLIDEGI